MHRSPSVLPVLSHINQVPVVPIDSLNISLYRFINLPHHALGLYWVPWHPGVRGNEIADELARDVSALKFVGPEPALWVFRQDIRRRIRRWSVNQHWVWWRGLGNTQRQARKLILGPCLGAKARVLS